MLKYSKNQEGENNLSFYTEKQWFGILSIQLKASTFLVFIMIYFRMDIFIKDWVMC